MEQENIFKWKHYQPDIILLTVRWYLRVIFRGNLHLFKFYFS